MKLRLESSFAEFITVYDENDNEIAEFQSSEIKKLKNSICSLLNHLSVDYELKN